MTYLFRITDANFIAFN